MAKVQIVKISEELHTKLKIEAAQKRQTIRVRAEEIFERHFAKKGGSNGKT